jgi:hypothetical protein
VYQTVSTVIVAGNVAGVPIAASVNTPAAGVIDTTTVSPPAATVIGYPVSAMICP